MLIDSGQANETLYYVMPFVEGGSLRGRIDQGRLGLEETTSIIEKVADAICYAHQQGVVHRDIKPENILFSRGYPVVADFGIAKAISTAGVTALTRTGFPLGTVGYMSPEQAAGASDLGPASDVYSLACVTYEMLVGAVPGVWLSDAESDEGHLMDIPGEHRKRLDGLPAHVEAALARALARRPRDRFDDPGDFVTALQGKTEVKRRFAEPQVHAIIQQAADSQFANPTSDGSLTVGAIEAIAADVGLSPQRVHDAIVQLDSTANAPALPPGLFSLPSHIEMETSIAGEIPQSEFGSLLEEIRRNLREVGRVNETMGRSLSWNSSSFQNSMTGSGRLIHITVSPKHGETKLSITETGGAHRFVVFVGSVMGGGVLGVLLYGATGGGYFAAVAVIGASMAGAYVAGRIGMRRFLRSRYQALGGLMRKLANVSREAIENHQTE